MDYYVEVFIIYTTISSSIQLINCELIMTIRSSLTDINKVNVQNVTKYGKKNSPHTLVTVRLS